jgi:hypothetical protein
MLAILRTPPPTAGQEEMDQARPCIAELMLLCRPGQA